MRQLGLTIIVVSLVAAATARAQKDVPMSTEAKAHFDRGIAHYAAKEYDEASRELSEAYFADPKREILFAWAQSKRLGGDCASAIPLYRKYLDSKPPSKAAVKAKAQLAMCEKEVGPGGVGPDPSIKPEPKPEPVAEPPPPEPKPDVRVSPEPEPEPITRRRPFYKDVLGDVMVGVGAVGLGVGATFWVKSSSSKSAAGDATSYADFQQATKDGRRQRTIAIVGLVGGGAILAGGILRWAIHGGGKEQVPEVAITGDGGGAQVSVGWTF